MANGRKARWEAVGSKLRLFGLSQILANPRDSPRSTEMPKAKAKKSKGNAPTASNDPSTAAGLPRGAERCWCLGFGIGCGLPRSARTRSRHARKQRKIRESIYHNDMLFARDR